MTARIYRPARTAMQAGRGKTKQWLLVFEEIEPRSIDPLMGYTTSSDTRTQVKLTFDTLEEAETYARRNGIPYTVLPEHRPTPKRSAYPDNFRSDRKSPWTH